MMPMLDVRNLRLRLPDRDGTVPILRGVSFEIAEGEAVALVGESGSGKSMTARCLVRLLPPGASVTGDVRVDGVSVLDMTRRQLSNYRASTVGMIFQDPRAHMNPVQTVGDFLTEQMRVIRRTPARHANSRAIQLLDEVRIPNPGYRMRQYPHELSGGMLQRVMIAGALAADARLLLADEPTTALDVTTQAEIMAILMQLRRDHHLTLLLITHDLELAAAICDHTLVMYAGSIVESTTSAALESHPRHPYSYGLLASRPNLDKKPPRLPVIPGRPIAAYEALPGCAFAPRCFLADDLCRDKNPEPREVASSWVACHHAERMTAPTAVSAPDAS